METELERLPRWARVAWAARCLRRVLPALRDTPGGSGFTRVVEAIEAAAAQASADTEDIAALADYCSGLACAPYPQLSHAASAAEVAALSTLAALWDANIGDAPSSLVRHSSEYAPGFDKSGAEEILNRRGRRVVEVAVMAAGAARGAASLVRGTEVDMEVAERNALVAAGVDLEALLQFADKRGWDDETAVSPDCLGPLWPHGLSLHPNPAYHDKWAAHLKALVLVVEQLDSIEEDDDLAIVRREQVERVRGFAKRDREELESEGLI